MLLLLTMMMAIMMTDVVVVVDDEDDDADKCIVWSFVGDNLSKSHLQSQHQLCRQQQLSSELLSLRWSHYISFWYSQVQTIYNNEKMAIVWFQKISIPPPWKVFFLFEPSPPWNF